jgi:hypothetical protein
MPIGSFYSDRKDSINTYAASRYLAIGAFCRADFANSGHVLASIHRVNSDVALLCLPRLVMIRTVFQRAAFPPLTCSAACPVLRLGTGTGGGRGGRGVR